MISGTTWKKVKNMRDSLGESEEKICLVLGISSESFWEQKFLEVKTIDEVENIIMSISSAEKVYQPALEKWGEMAIEEAKKCDDVKQIRRAYNDRGLSYFCPIGTKISILEVLISRCANFEEMKSAYSITRDMRINEEDDEEIIKKGALEDLVVEKWMALCSDLMDLRRIMNWSSSKYESIIYAKIKEKGLTRLTDKDVGLEEILMIESILSPEDREVAQRMRESKVLEEVRKIEKSKPDFIKFRKIGRFLTCGSKAEFLFEAAVLSEAFRMIKKNNSLKKGKEICELFHFRSLAYQVVVNDFNNKVFMEAQKAKTKAKLIYIYKNSFHDSPGQKLAARKLFKII
jgi:hypothetical protein